MLLDLLAACIERYTGDGPAAVEQLLAAHPEHAAELRARLLHLERLGLLGAPADDLPRRMGPYRIQGRIGCGGMSEVFLAHDDRMDRVVALKCAHPGLALGERARERFRREIRAVAQLSHPAIVPVFDAGESHGRAYFTMEFVEGATLANVLTRLRAGGGASDAERVRLAAELVGAPDPPVAPWDRSYVELACRWVLALADALDHAHAAGVVHRDVNPSNVMLRPDGRAQLFDFGLARLADTPSMTRAGEFTGTPYYVSPEQVAGGGESADARSDVYSAGVTLYELLTLRRPFEGDSTAEVLNRIQTGEPTPPRRVDPGIPRDLELVCLTAIDRDRARRYGSAAELAADLRRFLAFEPVAARPLGRAERALRLVRRRPWAAVAAALAALLLVGLPPALLWANAIARRERDAALAAAEAAERSMRLSREVEDFLVGLFELERNESPDVPVRELIARGLDRIPRGLGDGEDAVQTELLEVGGRVYAKLGMHADSYTLLNRAVQRRMKGPGVPDPRVAETYAHLARAMIALEDPEQAHVLGEVGLRVLEGNGLQADPRRAELQLLLADADARLGRRGGTQEHLHAAGELRRELFGRDSEELAEVHARLGELALALGWHEDARAVYERALEPLEDAWSPDPDLVAACRRGLAAALTGSGASAAAAEHAAHADATDARRARWESRLSAPLPVLPLDFRGASWREEYVPLLNGSLRALHMRDVDAARRGFERCLELRPGDLLATYNLACVEAVAGDADACLALLERAVEGGYGRGPNLGAETLRHDTDLRGVQGDPRLEPLIERIRAISRQPLERALDAGSPGAPLLVRLVDSTRSAAAQSPLTAAARALGWSVLSVAPPCPTGAGNPGWLADPAGFRRFAEDLRPLALAPVGEHLGGGAEPARVLIAGEGDGGPLATSLALHHPGLFRGLVLFDAYPGPEQRDEATRRAALSGLQVAVAHRADTAIEWLADGAGPAELLAATLGWFDALALDARGRVLAPGEPLEPLLAELVAAANQP